MPSNRYCSKVRHADRDSAARHARALRRKDQRAGEIAVYRCPDCGHWHAGHRYATDGRRPRRLTGR